MADVPIGGAYASVTNNRIDQLRAVSNGTINIIARINAVCRAHRIPVSTFGRRAVNDSRLVPDLIDGRSLRPATEARILHFIEKLEA